MLSTYNIFNKLSSSSRGWEISEDEIHESEDKGKVIIFTRKLNDSVDILYQFVELLQFKPDGYWLIRESRQEGMISITYKLNEKIDHQRYAFIDDKWKIIADSDVESSLEHDKFQGLGKGDITDKCEQLLRLIFENNTLKYENMLLPSKKEASHNSSYSDYVQIAQPYCTVGKRKEVYGNPVLAMQNVNNILKSINNTFSNSSFEQIKEYLSDVKCMSDVKRMLDIKLPEQITSKELSIIFLSSRQPFKEGKFVKEVTTIKECLANWLESCELNEDLFCPITMELFTNPYFVAESGQIFDADGIMPENKLLKDLSIPSF